VTSDADRLTESTTAGSTSESLARSAHFEVRQFESHRSRFDAEGWAAEGSPRDHQPNPACWKNVGPVVAFVRDPQKAEGLERAGAKLRQGTLEDEASLRKAFAGADTVVLNVAGETLAEQVCNAIRAARATAIRKVVLVSSSQASLDGPTESTRQHALADEALRASGLSFVILRPHSFMQNLFGSIGSIRAGKLFSGTGACKLGFIDVRDIADALVAAATSDAWNGQTLDLTGPESIDYATVAAEIGKQLGREVVYVPVSPQVAGEAVLKATGDVWHARTVEEFAVASSAGFGDFTTNNVARLTGHAPRSIHDFVRDELTRAVGAGR
jgi:uncharacterized protein YbjT (DUF2867 family)